MKRVSVRLGGKGDAIKTGTVEDRVTVLETEFRTELRHLATKADLYRLGIQLAVIQITVVGAAVAFLKFTG